LVNISKKEPTCTYDRDYKSFYPIAVTKVDFGGNQQNILLSEIKVGDRILVRNQEIIPVDAVLINGEGNIDNSFITGESATISKNPEIKFSLAENKLVLF
jgi:Cu+-exporting ATPase